MEAHNRSFRMFHHNLSGLLHDENESVIIHHLSLLKDSCTLPTGNQPTGQSKCEVNSLQIDRCGRQPTHRSHYPTKSIYFARSESELWCFRTRPDHRSAPRPSVLVGRCIWVTEFSRWVQHGLSTFLCIPSDRRWCYENNNFSLQIVIGQIIAVSLSVSLDYSQLVEGGL